MKEETLSLIEHYKKGFISVQEIYQNIKANPDYIIEKDDYGNTLLHYAIKDTKAVLVELLIRCGSDLNSLNVYNETPLLFGLNNGYVSIEILKLLLRNRISVNDVDKWGRSACFFSSRNIEFLSLLCLHGADINISNENGYTPLMRSAITENVQHIKTMIEIFKANPDMTDDKGKTALTYAIDSNNNDVADYLLNVCLPHHNEIQKSSIKRFLKKKVSDHEIF